MNIEPQNDPQRLVLGTAQLGMDYGIANPLGMPDQKVADAIVDEALSGGIREFDTAQGYGRSEEVLGRALARHPLKDEARIISKLSPNLQNISSIELRSSVQTSLERLGVDRLYGLLLHREDYLDLWSQGLGESLETLVKEGLVEHLGVSVYSPQRARTAFGNENLSIIQIPSNILDSRFETAGLFVNDKKKDKKIYVRSIFLQGLLLMDKIPSRMRFARSYVQKIHLVAEEYDLSVYELALEYAKECYGNAGIIVGVDSVSQLRRNILYWKNSKNKIDKVKIRKMLGSVPERVVNPCMWPPKETSEY